MYESKVQTYLRTFNLSTLSLISTEKSERVPKFRFASVLQHFCTADEQYFLDSLSHHVHRFGNDSFRRTKPILLLESTSWSVFFDQLRMIMRFCSSNCTSFQRLHQVLGHLVLLIFEMFTVYFSEHWATKRRFLTEIIE